MNRHTIALAGAATAVLMSAAALATAAGDAPTTIEACRNTRHGLVRIVFSAERLQEQRDPCLVGRRGPGRPGRPRRPGRASWPEGGFRIGDQLGRRARRHGLQDIRRRDGHVEVGSTATDLITAHVRAGAGTAAAPHGQRQARDQRGRLRPGRGGCRRLRRDRQHRHGCGNAGRDGARARERRRRHGVRPQDADGHARCGSEARGRRRSSERRARTAWRSSTRRRRRCSMRSATRVRSTRPRSAPRCST